MIRIVRLSFKEDKIAEFQKMFEEVKFSIRNFPGVQHLELWQDKNSPNVFFTYSKWRSEEDLNNYRNSELFKGIWAKTKIHFNDKPMASSVDTFIVPVKL